MDRPGAITLQGAPFTLTGQEPSIGTGAPGFTVVNESLAPVTLSSFLGRTVIVSAVPSLDTPVCDRETKRFNEEAANLSADAVILTISMDLPFAQKRWCLANSVDRVIVLSDHRDASFGLAYGILIKELRLLARAIFIIDREGLLRYRQLVTETTSEPDYDAVLDALKRLG